MNGAPKREVVSRKKPVLPSSKKAVGKQYDKPKSNAKVNMNRKRG